ncbi:cytosolic Cu Zn superoxide dismutase [Fusarium mexicanum]|uniref:superoxide dismutase n=1 Tax=Fusarium mexicanum TaxID=751941 RepID=A0A8H5IVY0_9HYPO|nr:cytosolic Cu Zn superoxide dismutase [Fusarium mexicanum]
MRTQAIVAVLFSALAGQVVGQDDSHNAPRVNDNPIGVKYKATLPKEPFFKDAAIDGNVKGFIEAEAPSDGHGVQFKVQFSNLPKEGGPFTYHIHVEPVPENGNCTATLAHLDPFARGEEPPCDPEKPASCQVGDNSGKHGKITSDPFTADYIDYYASTKEGIGAYFGNRSFVLHYANKTRLTCANFVNLNPGVIDGNYTVPAYLPTPTETVNPETNTPTPSSTGTSTGSKPISTETSVVSPNGASSATLPINLALAGVFAFILAM